MALSERFYNKDSDCRWLRETHLAPKNLNNGIPFEFRSFVLMGNEDCPSEIIIYGKRHPALSDRYARATLCDNGCYSFVSVQEEEKTSAH